MQVVILTCYYFFVYTTSKFPRVRKQISNSFITNQEENKKNLSPLVRNKKSFLTE